MRVLFGLQQYWADQSEPYKFVPVTAFVERFQETQAAQRMHDVLDMPYDRAASPEGALVRCILSVADNIIAVVAC
jgi:hypothetical protein